MRKVQAYQLHSYLKLKFKMTEQELFDLPEGKRKVIINSLFEKFAGHRLFKDGLTNTKNNKDKFDNYRSYSHLKNLEMAVTDINITKQKSRNKLERWKRQIHLAKKERFNARKSRKVNQLNMNMHKQKWKPKNKETNRRLEKLRKLKEKEQSQEYER